VVDVVDGRHVHVGDGGVVVERVASPVAADVTDAEVAEAVVDAAVETYVWAPVSGVPYVHAVRPSPVARRPQRANEGRDHPIAGYPVITSIDVPSPVAGHPDVTGSGAYRLSIDRNRRRSERHRQEHCALRSR